jgi:ribonuclease E
VNISRRINGENERNRLRALGVLIKPPGAGLLIRTEAEGVSEELLIDDLEALLRQWEAIQQAAETATPPVLLNRDEDFIHRVLRDLYSPELARVVVDTAEAVGRVRSFLGADQATVVVEAHAEPSELLEHFRVTSAIRDALKPRVELPSGGYIIIEPTEALTVIDVNSGSFTRSANARETVLWTNCEAAVEIARQLKLRNIGGVVIVDFIDMDSRRDQLQLLEHFTQAVRDDAARPQIAQLTELGLVELTRKRQGQNIYELFGRPCPSCGGLGHVAVLPGRDTLQPLATVSGLVRSVTATRSESPAVAAAIPETSGGGRRRRGRGGRSTESGEAPVSAEASLYPPSVEAGVERTEAPSRRVDHDFVAVPMEPEQERVYGWLGLSPALLLDPVPSGDNLVVRVVRPGADAEQVLEEARQQLAASGSRRRRRGRGGEGRGGQGEEGSVALGDAGHDGAIESEAGMPAPAVSEEPPGFTPVPLEPASDSPAEDSGRVPVPSRRRRRSSSAPSEETAEPASGPDTAAPVDAAAPPADSGDGAADDASAEPRRRRRRSSASG